MHFVLQTPSLQRLSAVKIIAHLWSQPDIVAQIATSFHGLSNDDVIEYTPPWKEIEDKVQCKISALSLPEPCKNELSDVIRPIGVEIIVWCQYHNLDSYPFNFLDKLLPLQFCWTMNGTVNYTNTAELIVKDERLDVVRRFEVACLNCLEDAARQFFPFLPNDRIHKYISEAVRYENMDRRILVAYFTCVLSGDEDLFHRLFQAMDLETESINQYLLNVVIYRGSRATCEYFLQKVSQEEKDEVFEWYEALQYRDQDSPTCGMMYYLTRMNKEVFVECTADVLIGLLRWPMQSLFVKAAKRGWHFMDGIDCAEILDDVIFKIDDYKDYDYIQLFKELWRLTPAEHKEYFFNKIDHLEDLIATKRAEFIRLCLKGAPSHQLRQLIENKHLFEDIIRVLVDESVISDAALMECKRTAALNSSKDEDNEEKRLRSECVSRLVDMAMESRIKSRENNLAGVTSS